MHQTLVRPSWTVVNLLVYCFVPALRRGAYASMWGIVASFYGALALRADAHRRLMEKQGMGPVLFYGGDVILHWIPLWTHHVPFEGYGANALGAVVHLVWGAVLTRGTMDLSDVYAPLPRRTWWCLLSVACAVTLWVPV